ncbi:TetR/AcrR family transcriptional regulator [Leeia sp. TBRC 13508]|uniref:TetR/AcrR family transcriptional regulator n=1 Tax=Leeia speluncae TaxID=2884804 RepID=A0ABS8D6G4_9NEIS|nr:TetR/AcrR family transcriptional regulator [Leeia speluncae]MCB6183804.1 TetR/AcrR family transcriptional regulator [Leeia speluncae]
MMKDTPRTDTKEHLLDTAEAIIRGKGFSAVGLAEILQTAGVPKGSFYHYFKSKEGFGVELLARYFEQYGDRLRLRLASNEFANGRERLMDYFQRWTSASECSANASFCLAIKLAAEVSDLSEPMREELETGMSRVMQGIAEMIRVAQADGSVPAALNPEDTAQSLYSLWVGASLLYKVQQSSVPVKLAMQQTEWLLGKA